MRLHSIDGTPVLPNGKDGKHFPTFLPQCRMAIARPGQPPTTFTALPGATLTVFFAATYRSTISHTGGPSLPWLTLAQPATAYSRAASIGLPLLMWVRSEMRLPIGLPTSIV